MRKIILIADERYSGMVERSVKGDVDVALYLCFEGFYTLNKEEQESEKIVFLNEIQEYLVENGDDIDFIFCFIHNSHLQDEELADWVKAALLYCKFSKEKIIDAARIYSSFFKKERYRRLLDNPGIEQVDGLVFGISLGMIGINSTYLPGKVVNLACSSQDIHYNYYIAQRVWEEYYEKVKGLKYVVIEMYDWTYFNFDTLMTGVTVDYFIRSGFDCPEELDKKEYKSVRLTSREINNFLRNIRTASEDERALLNDFFENVVNNDELAYSDVSTRGNGRALGEVEIVQYERHKRDPALKTKIFEKTIEKNVAILCEFIDFLYRNNPDTKIFFCLIPKYISAEMYESKMFPHWKNFFEETINKICETKRVVCLNYKDDKEISANQQLYEDIIHLNHEGSVVFTKKLADDISEYL